LSRKARPALRRHAAQSCGSGSSLPEIRSIRNFAFLVREGAANAETAQALAEGFITADFETDKYKTEKKNGKEIESGSNRGLFGLRKVVWRKGLGHWKSHCRIAKFYARPRQ